MRRVKVTEAYARESDVMVVRLPASPEEIDPSFKRGRVKGPRSRRLARLELIAVLVVVSMLGVVTLSAFHGATHDGAVAACNASVKEVGSAIAALQAENPSTEPTTSDGWRASLLPGSAYVGAPFLGSWPDSGYYAISIGTTGMGAGTGDGITPRNGDVLVTIRAHGLAYDATVRPGVGCATA
jgi:hypothetical protein